MLIHESLECFEQVFQSSFARIFFDLLSACFICHAQKYRAIGETVEDMAHRFYESRSEQAFRNNAHCLQP